MIKIVERKTDIKIVILMGAMEPLQVGRIVSQSSSSVGHIVLRTASTSKFEVMDITDGTVDACWELSMKNQGLEVELLSPDEAITLELSNG